MTKTPLDFLWFIPSSGDGAYLGTDTLSRPGDPAYFREIARAADRIASISASESRVHPWSTEAGPPEATSSPNRRSAYVMLSGSFSGRSSNERPSR